MTLIQGSKYSYIVVQAANIIAFISGTSVAWSSPVLAILEGDDLSRIPLNRQITGDESSWIGSLAAMGGVVGPFIHGYLMQRVGRRINLVVIVVPFLSAFLIAAFAETVYLYYVSRFLMGMGVGGAFCSVPVYVAEVAEDTNRGILQASTSTLIMIGILFSYCIGPYVSIMTFNLILSAICVIYIPVVWFAAVESPIYLILTNQEEQAFESLRYLRSKPDTTVRKELEAKKTHLEQFKPGTFIDIFETKGTIKALLFSVALTTFQQFSGINVVLYFTQDIFDATKSDLPPEVCSIIVGSAQLFVSIMALPFLDRAGRRIVLFIASTGALTAEILMGVYFYLQTNGNDVSDLGWLPVFSLVMFIAFYNFGMGPVPWASMGELLPSNIVAKASTLTTSFYWFTGFFLTKYFADLSDAIGMGGSFWLFAGLLVVCDLFVVFLMFETKGKSFAEIQAILNK
ncbi:facilitated trehalose transporter Tret1-like [Zophobas morio]|uniref:facilitated trehalose transporter Tret1-like n=1 Tax=Zophobas morio TaxID=2755281 RepID=UPI0030839253